MNFAGAKSDTSHFAYFEVRNWTFRISHISQVRNRTLRSFAGAKPDTPQVSPPDTHAARHSQRVSGGDRVRYSYMVRKCLPQLIQQYRDMGSLALGFGDWVSPTPAQCASAPVRHAHEQRRGSADTHVLLQRGHGAGGHGAGGAEPPLEARLCRREERWPEAAGEQDRQAWLGAGAS